jgi:hypothetical protein
MRAAALALAIGLLLCGYGSARAHEHMYIGSTAKNGGALLLRYDFTRAFPMVPLPGTLELIGNDPAFNAQVVDDPTQGIYRLKDGTRVAMELVSADPGVSVDLNGEILVSGGDRVRIGRMPYLHQHPQWTLASDPGPGATPRLSFRVTANGYDPSPVYSATLAPPAPATTTTLPQPTTTTSTTMVAPGTPTTTSTPGATTTSTTFTTSTTISPCHQRPVRGCVLRPDARRRT